MVGCYDRLGRPALDREATGGMAIIPMLVTFISALVLAGVHVFSGSLRLLDKIPRSRWLSFAGGVAVALAFLKILPELAESQESVARAVDPFSALKNHVYIIAVIGWPVPQALFRISVSPSSVPCSQV